MARLYFTHIQGTGTSQDDARRPKYFADIVGLRWAMMDYGREDICLVLADTDQTQHDAVILNADVIALPTNLDNMVPTAAVANVEAKLEAMNIPADWVNDKRTWRTTLRIVCGLFQLAQRFHGEHGENFLANVNLNMTVSQMGAPKRQKIEKAIDTLRISIDKSQITGATTVRQILREVGKAWANTPIYIGGFEI